MEENFDQNKETQSDVKIVSEKPEKNNNCWMKYLVVSMAAFFGAFLAVYFAVDMMFHRYLVPVPPPVIKVQDIDDMVKQQEQMMQDFMKYKPITNPFVQSPVKVQTFQENDKYKIIVDLKPFNGDEKAIKLDVTADTVKITGKSEKTTKGAENEISFMQSFSLPQKIDVDDVKTEKKGSDYVITLPIED